MSGGSMDYLYSRVQGAEFRRNTPERRAFSAHLEKVAEALRAIEWSDSGDSSEDAATRAILKCLEPAALTVQLKAEALILIEHLKSAVRDAS
jgi:hypothetical protein